MEHQICSIEELAEHYCKKLPRPKVEIETLVNDVMIGFESIRVIGRDESFHPILEPVYYMSYMKHNGDNKEKCKNKLLNDFILSVAFQAEELSKRQIIMKAMADLSRGLCE